MENYKEMEKYIHLFMRGKYCEVEVNGQIEYRFTKINFKTITLRVIISFFFWYYILSKTPIHLINRNELPIYGFLILLNIFFSLVDLHPNIVIDKYGIKTYRKYGKWIKQFRWDDIFGINICTSKAWRYTVSLVVKIDGKGYEKPLEKRFGIEKKYHCEFIKLSVYSSFRHMAWILMHYADKNKIDFITNCVGKSPKYYEKKYHNNA